MKNTLLAITLFLSACGSNGNESASVAKKVAGQSCSAQVADLSSWMTKFRDEGGHEWPDSTPEPSIDMVTLAADAPSDYAAIVSLDLAGAMANDTHLGMDVDAWGAILKDTKKAADKRAPSHQTLGLIVGKETPWHKVVAAVSAASQAGFPTVEFVFKAPSKPRVQTLSPPAASTLTKEIAAARIEMEKRLVPSDPAKQLPALSATSSSESPSLLKQSAAACPALLANIDATAAQDPTKRIEHMTDSVVAAVKQCDCQADIPALKEIYWYLLPSSRRTNAEAHTAFAVTPVGPEADGAIVVTAPTFAAWKDVHAKLAALQKGTTPRVSLKTE